jgi:hypothetical protein
MNLANHEYIELKEYNKDGENPTYIFHGINNEIFELVFDNKEKYFKIIRNKNDDVMYALKCENSYRPPDLKKLIVAYKYIDTSDTNEEIQNIFHYGDLKIANISTTFESFYDEKLKRNMYTKKPKYYTYLIKYNNYCTILSYNENKYTTKAINLHKNNCEYF